MKAIIFSTPTAPNSTFYELYKQTIRELKENSKTWEREYQCKWENEDDNYEDEEI